MKKATTGINFTVFDGLIHFRSRRYIIRYTPESVEDVLQAGSGEIFVRFCEGAHGTLGAIDTTSSMGT